MAGRRNNRDHDDAQTRMEGFIAVMSQLNRTMQRLEQNGLQPFQVRNNNISMIEAFMRQRPPTFSGCIDPIKAEEWIAMLENIFEVLQCSEKEKDRLAVYRLIGD